MLASAVSLALLIENLEVGESRFWKRDRSRGVADRLPWAMGNAYLGLLFISRASIYWNWSIIIR